MVAVVGRPSSGKSTLVNALCGAKVSIVSPVPQTTRNRIRGILNDPRGQVVFIDTPGFHLSQKKLNRYMTDLVSATLSEVDIVLYVVDGTRETGDEERAIQKAIRGASRPLVTCMNKHDAPGPNWQAIRTAAADALPGAQILEISARTGGGLATLKDSLFSAAPEGDQMLSLIHI